MVKLWISIHHCLHFITPPILKVPPSVQQHSSVVSLCQSFMQCWICFLQPGCCCTGAVSLLFSIPCYSPHIAVSSSASLCSRDFWLHVWVVCINTPLLLGWQITIQVNNVLNNTLKRISSTVAADTYVTSCYMSYMSLQWVYCLCFCFFFFFFLWWWQGRICIRIFIFIPVVDEINRQQVCWMWSTTPVRWTDCHGKGEILDIFVEVQCTTAATVTYKLCFSLQLDKDWMSRDMHIFSRVISREYQAC